MKFARSIGDPNKEQKILLYEGLTPSNGRIVATVHESSFEGEESSQALANLFADAYMIKKQRDELLEVLKDMLRYWDVCERLIHPDSQLATRVWEAIEKCEPDSKHEVV